MTISYMGGAVMSSDPFGIMSRPSVVDEQIRQAIIACWTLLPAEKRTIGQVKTQIQRIVDRAFANLDEDLQAFQSQADLMRGKP